MKLLLQNFLILAALFSPGYLLVQWARVKLRLVAEVTTALVLSLVVNYIVLLIFVVTAAPPTLLVVIYALTGIAAVAVIVRQLSGALHRPMPAKVFTARRAIEVVAVLLLLAASVRVVVEDYEPVFRSWDAVVSWNRWAIDWSNLTFPQRNYGYPQLISAQIGLIYIIAGNIDHQIYGRLLHAAFAVLPTILFLDLYRISRRVRYLIAAGAFGYALSRLPNELLDGYMDLPVAAVSFFFCYLWLLTRYLRPRNGRAVIIAGMLISSAALVKQSGILTTAYFGALFGSSIRERKRLLVFSVVLITVFASWYGIFQVRSFLGYDMHNIAFVTGAEGNLHKGRNLAERFVFALGTLTERLGLLAVIVTALSLAYATASDRKFRKIGLYVAVYFVAWCLFWSYSLRHAALIVPFSAWAVGLASESVLIFGRTAGARRFGSEVLHSRGMTSALFVATVFVGLIILSLFTSDRRMLAYQRINMTRLVGNSAINRDIRSAAAAGEIKRVVFTNYHFLTALPDFRDHIVKRNDLFRLQDAQSVSPLEAFTVIELRERRIDQKDWLEKQLAAGKVAIRRETPLIRVIEVQA